MEIKAKDVYRVESAHSIESNTLQVLTNLYQPLIESNGLLLYLTLLSESKRETLESFSKLLTITNMDPNSFDRAIAKLEEYMLVRSYYKAGETRDTYLFILHKPLSAKDFMASSVYMSRFRNAVGQKNSELILSNLLAGTVNTSEFEDITRKIRHRKEEYDNSVSYVQIQPKYNFSNEDDSIEFDYEKFISTTSSLVFPVELRTKDNMNLIGKLATVHGLSVDRMRILVSKCVDLETIEFDTEKLMVLAKKAEPDVTKAKDPYDLPPVSFLQSKQKGAEVSLADKKILEKLSMDMHFSNPVINVLIEHILKISDNRLNPQFVYKIAGEWARDGVSSKEDAINETKKEITTSKYTNPKKKVELPDHIKAQKEGKFNEGKKLTKEEADKLKAKVKK